MPAHDKRARIAYVVLAHARPAQLFRLLDRLSDGIRVLHYDAKSFDGAQVRSEAERRGIWVVPPRDVSWGHWNTVEATMASFELALRGDPDHLVLLSGQCYPLTPAVARQAFFADRQGYSVINHLPIPFPGWPGFGGSARTRLVHVRTPRWMLSLPHPKRLTPMLPLPIPRRVPAGVMRHGGSQWSAISAEAVRYLLELGPDSNVVKLYRRSLLPDEQFMQTALASSPLRHLLIDDLLHHFDFVDAHPRIFGSADFEELATCGRLFARKFDTGVDSEILDRIDDELLDVRLDESAVR